MSRVLLNANDEIIKKYNPFFHRGLGIKQRMQRVSEVISHSEGIVVEATKNRKYGNYVKIKHNNGMYTLYGYLSKISVKQNDYVKRGQVLGTMGNSGKVKDILLHFEIRNQKDKRINPTKYLANDLPNNKEKNKIYYQVYDNKKQRWLKRVSEVYDYSGNIGNPISAIIISLNEGDIKYRVHEIDGWCSYVCNQNDYAGNVKKNINGLEINSDSVKLVYRVHLLGGEWMPWIENLEVFYDEIIDGIQIRILED